jgi:hypothetical protein
MKEPILIYADFMKFDGDKLILVCHGTFKDLAKHNIAFEEGKSYVFYSDDEDNDENRDDLVVEGKAEYDTDNQRWTARINFDEIKNVSQLSEEEKD